MKTEDIVILGLAAVGVYFALNKGQEIATNAVSEIGKRTISENQQMSNPEQIILPNNFSVPAKGLSELNPDYNLYRSIDDNGALSTYRVRQSDLTPYEKYMTGQNLFSIENDTLKTGLSAVGSKVKSTAKQLQPILYLNPLYAASKLGSSFGNYVSGLFNKGKGKAKSVDMGQQSTMQNVTQPVYNQSPSSGGSSIGSKSKSSSSSSGGSSYKTITTNTGVTVKASSGFEKKLREAGLT